MSCGHQHPTIDGLVCSDERENHPEHACPSPTSLSWVYWANDTYVPAPPPEKKKAFTPKPKAKHSQQELLDLAKRLTNSDPMDIAVGINGNFNASNPVRRTDADTSHAAARSLDLSVDNERVRAVIELVSAEGELTHHEIGLRLFEMGVVMEPELGRRAARTASDEGVLVPTGRKALNRTGHHGYTFEVSR